MSPVIEPLEPFAVVGMIGRLASSMIVGLMEANVDRIVTFAAGIVNLPFNPVCSAIGNGYRSNANWPVDHEKKSAWQFALSVMEEPFADQSIIPKEGKREGESSFLLMCVIPGRIPNIYFNLMNTGIFELYVGESSVVTPAWCQFIKIPDMLSE